MPTLICGLPYAVFMELRTHTAMNRLSQPEAQAIFDKLAELGFKVVPAE